MPTQALPDDIWLGTDLIKEQVSKLQIRLNVESVGDDVDYAPNLESGGFAAEHSRPRYQSGSMELNWMPTDRLTLTGSFKQRQFISKRDDFQLQEYSLSFNYALPTVSDRRTYLFSAGVSSNLTDRIHKNSYSQYGGNLLTSVQIHDPYDVQAQVNIAGRFELTPRVNLSVFTGGGYAATGHSSITGTGQSDEGCRYRFTVGDDNGSLDQIGPCGDVVEFSQQYPDYQAVQSNLGFDPEKDIKSQAGYWQFGGNLSFQTGRVVTSLGYYYQRFNRGKFDERIRNKGKTVISDNHTIATRLDYGLSNWLTITGQVVYNSRKFLNQVPILYTGATSDRFSDDVLYFSLSATIALSR